MSCAAYQKQIFPPEIRAEKLITTARDSISFQNILDNHKGRQIFVQIFASYCPVSEKSFADVVRFQKQNSQKAYVFISVDHSYYDWKRALVRIKPKGYFYYLPKKENSLLAKFLKLKSVPRFLKINEQGRIVVFKSSKVSEKLQ